MLSAAGAAIAPAVVVAGVLTTGYAVTGVTSFPLALVVVAVVLAIFLPGYVAVARRIRNAGAFYTYVSRGLGKVLGVGASAVAVPAYAAMSIATYGAIGAVGANILAEKFGLAVAWWVVAVVVWLIVAVLAALRISISGRVLMAALVVELAVVLLADIANLAHPHQGRVSFDAWDPSTLTGAWGIAFAIGATAYVGFEAPAVFSEETRGRSTVALATSLALIGACVLYALSGWAMAATVGSANLQQAAGEHGPDLPFVLAAEHLGSTFIVDIGRLLFVSSLFAAALAYHNTVSRYLYALGRESVLPAWLGRVSPRTAAPRAASLVQSALGISIIVIYAASGADPLVHLFFWGGTIGGLGVLVLVTLTSASIIGILRGNRTVPWAARTVLPGLAAILLAGMVWLIIDNLNGLLGVEPASPLRWAVPGAYLLLLLTGLAWAAYLRLRRPAIYDAIGLDTNPHLASNPPRFNPGRFI